jgi:uncharacterized membrane protein YgdD (TMEM256/DUF423 family)
METQITEVDWRAWALLAGIALFFASLVYYHLKYPIKDYEDEDI